MVPRLHNRGYARGIGTLATAAYLPAEDRIEYRWPGHGWQQSIADFRTATPLGSLSGCRSDWSR